MGKTEKVALIGELEFKLLNLAGYRAKTYQAEHECNVHKIQESCYEVEVFHGQAQDTAEEIGKLLVKLLL